MGLVAMKEMLARARRGGYAVAYCESWNLESLQAVVEAGEAENAPLIAGFNGGFLGHPGRTKPEDLSYYSSFASALNQRSVPVSFLLNESDDFGQMAQAIKLGFNAVMVENENLQPAAYRELVERVVKLAHPRGVSVEAQIGHLPNACGQNGGEETDPAAARAFVEETGVDALGVAVGNVHILTQGTRPLNEKALEILRDAVPVPLVLHGGTGIPMDVLPRLPALGVAKVNFGTNLKQVYLAAVREKLAPYRTPMSPHPFLGMGGPDDILVAGREAVKAKTRELIRALGGSGKA
jgi:fructose/tagatose bisphosphate aldolase